MLYSEYCPLCLSSTTSFVLPVTTLSDHSFFFSVDDVYDLRLLSGLSFFDSFVFLSSARQGGPGFRLLLLLLSTYTWTDIWNVAFFYLLYFYTFLFTYFFSLLIVSIFLSSIYIFFHFWLYSFSPFVISLDRRLKCVFQLLFSLFYFYSFLFLFSSLCFYSFVFYIVSFSFLFFFAFLFYSFCYQPGQTYEISLSVAFFFLPYFC